MVKGDKEVHVPLSVLLEHIETSLFSHPAITSLLSFAPIFSFTEAIVTSQKLCYGKTFIVKTMDCHP
jgi:hypothetical protein